MNAARSICLLIAASLLCPASAGATFPPSRRTVAEADSAPQPLIAVEQRFTQDGKAVLRVRNLTPFIVFIYVQDLRVGWLRGYRTGVIRGLRLGYHKVYAHSRWGNMHWGPRRLWIPTQWSLYR